MRLTRLPETIASSVVTIKPPKKLAHKRPVRMFPAREAEERASRRREKIVIHPAKRTMTINNFIEVISLSIQFEGRFLPGMFIRDN
jgi:hypothetical protein